VVYFFSKNWVKIVVKKQHFSLQKLNLFGGKQFWYSEAVRVICKRLGDGEGGSRAPARREQLAVLFLSIYRQNPEIAYNVPK
jgi:hypothetical protein